MADEIPSAQSGVAAGDDQARVLAEAAKRALAEAEARRLERDRTAAPPKEIGGRAGPDPVRYGDWEKDGVVSDF